MLTNEQNVSCLCSQHKAMNSYADNILCQWENPDTYLKYTEYDK